MFMYIYSINMPIVSRVFFISYVFLSTFVMLNMFTLVVTQQFEQFYFNIDNPISCFDEIANEFRTSWTFFTIRTKGTKIKERNLVDLFSILKVPLGYRIVDKDEPDDIWDAGFDN